MIAAHRQPHPMAGEQPQVVPLNLVHGLRVTGSMRRRVWMTRRISITTLTGSMVPQSRQSLPSHRDDHDSRSIRTLRILFGQAGSSQVIRVDYHPPRQMRDFIHPCPNGVSEIGGGFPMRADA